MQDAKVAAERVCVCSVLHCVAVSCSVLQCVAVIEDAKAAA